MAVKNFKIYRFNNYASIAPVAIAFILIGFLGLAFGFAFAILEPVKTTSLSIDWLIWNLLKASPIVGLFIIGSWVFVRAQRSR